MWLQVANNSGKTPFHPPLDIVFTLYHVSLFLYRPFYNRQVPYRVLRAATWRLLCLAPNDGGNYASSIIIAPTAHIICYSRFLFHSSPLFVAEEEELAERQAMKAQELEQVRKDVYGDTTPPLPPLAAAELAVKIHQVRKALMDSSLLSEEQTAAYRQALAQVPSLVEAETDWEAFLRVYDNHPSPAAERVARYWQVRTELFGPIKALLPMTLSGAMADDIALMELGLTFLLPADKHGRTVFYIDRTRYTLRVAPRESFLRVLFYMLFSISSRENTRKGEYVIVANVKVNLPAGADAEALLRLESLTPLLTCFRVLISTSILTEF